MANRDPDAYKKQEQIRRDTIDMTGRVSDDVSIERRHRQLLAHRCPTEESPVPKLTWSMPSKRPTPRCGALRNVRSASRERRLTGRVRDFPRTGHDTCSEINSLASAAASPTSAHPASVGITERAFRLASWVSLSCPARSL